MKPADRPASPTSAAIYCRVSTAEQSERGYSLEAQAQDCRRLATELGLQVVAAFQDVESGAEWDLPGLNALLDGAGRGEFGVVLCYDPDRLARRMAKQLVIEEELGKSGTTLRYVTLRLGDTAEDRLLKNVRASIAEYEREKIALRTSRGRRAKAERGLVVGAGVPPYGYRYTHDGEGRVIGLEPEPESADVVRRIFRELATVSANALCARLNDAGVPTYFGAKAGWATSTIRGIIENPAYLGTAAYGRRDTRKRLRDSGKWITIPVPPLVDRATWDAAHDGLQRRRQQRPALNQETEAAWPLRGLLNCERCGGALACTWSNGYRYYVCLRRQPGRAKRQGWPLEQNDDQTRCSLPPVPAEAFDEYAWNLVASTLLDADHLAGGMAAARESNAVATIDREARGERVRRDIARLRARLDRITIERLDMAPGSEGERTLRAAAADTEQQVSHLLAEEAALRAEPELGLTDQDARDLQDFVAEIGAGLLKAVPLLQRKVHLDLKLHGRVRDDEAGIELGRHRFSIAWQAVVELKDGGRDYKKTRVRYFTPDYAEWSAKYMKAPVGAR